MNTCTVISLMFIYWEDELISGRFRFDFTCAGLFLFLSVFFGVKIVKSVFDLVSIHLFLAVKIGCGHLYMLWV